MTEEPVDMNALLRRGGSLAQLNDAWARRLLGTDPEHTDDTDDTDGDTAA